jgi:hypothetical protein
MITNFLKNGLSSFDSLTNISNKNNNPPPKTQTTNNSQIEVEKIADELMDNLIIILNDKIGEKFDENEIR